MPGIQSPSADLFFQFSFLYTGDTTADACKFTGKAGAVLESSWVDALSQINSGTCTNVASSMPVDSFSDPATMDVDWIIVQPAVCFAYGEFAR